jgi:hypothetical protein
MSARALDTLALSSTNRADCERDALRVDVGGVLVVNHVVGKCDLPLLVADDRELQAAA